MLKLSLLDALETQIVQKPCVILLAKRSVCTTPYVNVFFLVTIYKCIREFSKTDYVHTWVCMFSILKSVHKLYSFLNIPWDVILLLSWYSNSLKKKIPNVTNLVFMDLYYKMMVMKWNKAINNNILKILFYFNFIDIFAAFYPLRVTRIWVDPLVYLRTPQASSLKMWSTLRTHELVGTEPICVMIREMSYF